MKQKIMGLSIVSSYLYNVSRKFGLHIFAYIYNVLFLIIKVVLEARLAPSAVVSAPLAADVAAETKQSNTMCWQRKSAALLFSL